MQTKFPITFSPKLPREKIMAEVAAGMEGIFWSILKRLQAGSLFNGTAPAGFSTMSFNNSKPVFRRIDNLKHANMRTYEFLFVQTRLKL
jgi:hypothetical protein